MLCVRRIAGMLLLPGSRLVPALLNSGGAVRIMHSGTDSSSGVASVDEPSPRPINKDRSNPVPVETSMAYLESAAYRATYGDEPVWRSYRRNHKGHIPPRKTRRTCVRGGQLATGSACPICRDEFLVLHYQNTALLRQFVSEFNGAVLDFSRTGLCQVQHRQLLAAMHKAKEYGTMSFDVPFRVYDYDEYAPVASE